MFDCVPASDISFEYEDSEISIEPHNSHHDSDFDNSYIIFENSVRFAAEVHYIEAPDFCDDDCSKPKIIGVTDRSEEHPCDIVDLDKQLFIAYMNGIHGVSLYKSRLQVRAQEIRQGRVHSPFFEPGSIPGSYLDDVLSHVIGVFRNLLVGDEFTELVSLCEQKTMAPPQAFANRAKRLLDRIEQLLSERLASDDVHVEKDELSFFAGGVAYALDDWSAEEN
jgi:hypothetical protein